VLRRVTHRLLRDPAARVLTGPVAFLVAGLIDVGTVSVESLRARVTRHRRD